MLVSSARRVCVSLAVLLPAATFVPSRTAQAVDLYSQNFESVTLGPIVTYQVMLRERAAWTATPPAGMAVDNTLMPPGVLGNPNEGVTEFEGWTFVDKAWWNASAGDQGRSGFVSGLGKIAVADSDTHDDFGNPDALGPYDTKLSTPSITIPGGTAANTISLNFRSSWMPEEIQTATITARYSTGANIEVLRWTSPAGDPKFHDINVNESVTVPLQNPAGATSVALDFRYFDATNNWWWGIDDIKVFTGGAPATDGVLRAIIDRNTSNVKIINNTGAAVSLRGYSLRSSAGAFNEPNAVFKADSDPNWVQFTAPNATTDLSEGHLDSFAFSQGAMIDLGNNVWRKFYQDASDITFQYLVAGNDNPIPAIVEFTGNGGASFPFLDLNFNGSIDPGDWDTFRAGFPVSLAGLPFVQRYQLGDLDNDSLHTPKDFLRFRSEYDAALGAGAFAAMAASVPEPVTSLLFLIAAIAAVAVRMPRQRQWMAKTLPAAAVACFLAATTNSAHAQLTLFTENFEGLTLGPNQEEALAGSNVWTKTGPAGWVPDDTGMPGSFADPNTNGIKEWFGWSFASKAWWAETAGGQGRDQFTLGSGTVMIADPDEWDDGAHPDVDDQGNTGACGDALNPCMFDTFITTPVIAIPAGIPAGKIKIAFDSSWDDEGNDDSPFLANNQQATINVSYNGGAPINVLTFDSVPNPSPNFHDTAYSEAVQKDLQYNGTSTNMTLRFGLGFAENDWWWAVDNIRVFVPAEPSILRLDTGTGHASIVGGDVIPASINYIDITSASGALVGAGLNGLSTSKPNSVDGSDPGSTVGDSSGEYWQGLSATNNRITEAFLLGSSTFTDARTEFLGSIFNTGGAHDVAFVYTNIFGDVVNGVVQYCTNCSPAGVPGDYNNNGKVDAADYVLWRNGGPLQNEVDNPGIVNAADYTAWRARFGNTSGSGSGAQSAAVPEPNAGVLALVALGMGILLNRRRFAFSAPQWVVRLRALPARVSAACFTSIVIGLSLFVSAAAALPPVPVLDRNYRMGDEPVEGAVNGAPVGSANPSGLATRDSQGVAGMQQLIHLVPVGSPVYEALPTVSGGPVPKRPDNGTGLAIRLNPTAQSQGQHLKTGYEQSLNFPERSYSSTFQPGGTIDYSFIEDRGFQLWVLPQTSARADIVMDTNQHGALINSGGKFAMRYINTDYDTGVTVVPNTWYHLQVIRPFGSDRGSIMYVNGNAVARAAGVYAGEDNPANEETTPLVVGANTSTAPFQVGALNRFQGLVDDLEMAVMGLNAAADYGDFVFERDNKYAAFFKPSNPADLTGDNLVNSADVGIFASNWLSQKVVSGLVIGDLSSRMNGDFNFDGSVNLADWDILNDANPAAGAAAWALISAVPEPGSVCLAALAILGYMAGWRSKRCNQYDRA